MTCREIEPLLNARLDNELDVSGLAAVDQHLLECRVCAGQYAALERLHQEIVAADLAYAPPERLERKIAAAFPRERPRAVFGSPWWVAALAAAAAVAVALFLYVPRLNMETQDVSVEILDNHLRSLQPSHLVDVPTSDQHTVKPWFQGKTNFSPQVTDLSGEGFELLGGRLEVIHQRPAVAIVYRRRQHVINLYVSPGAGADGKVELRELQGYHLLHWSKSGMNYWAVSDLNTAELRDFANLVGGS